MEYPGRLLKKRFLDPLGITPYRLAKSIGVNQTRVSQIIHGKRAITADTAVRLGAFFGVPARWFMDMQVRYDLARAASSADGIAQFPGRYWVRPSGAQWLGPAPPARPTTHRVEPGFRERVRAQVALSPPRRPRQLVAVEYDNGMKAIVGKDDP
jgi:addiction module HigA family antidote